ncbi:MAG: chemotaxis protein CheB [Bacteroidia bacterium]
MNSRPILNKAIVIGGSAGSIPVIRNILSGLKRDINFPVIICVHRLKNIPEGICQVFASSSIHPVIEPNDKEPIKNGVIYLAPANYHLLIEKDMTFALSTDDMVNYSRPAIDLTIASTASAFRLGTFAFLLTGANSDGAFGMQKAKSVNATTIVQDPKECIAASMPLSALKLNCVDHVLSETEIITFINHI